MRFFKAFAFLVGASLLVWIVRKIGVEELMSGIRTLGWRLLTPILIIFPCYLLYTISWRLFLRRFDGHSIPFWTLFRMKVAGEASNTVTPFNFVGGDPIRIWLLSHYFPVSIGGASVVVDRTLQILAMITLTFLGNIAALFKLNLPTYARNLLGITVTLLFLFILLFIFYQRRGLFEKLYRLVNRFRKGKLSEKALEKVIALDQHLGDFYQRDRKLFLFCYSLHLIARLTGVIEIYVIGHFLGVPMGPWEALFFAAVIPVTNLLGAIVPGNFGILEGVVSSLFFALHWNPANGIVLQIARRLRAFFWIVLGLVFLLLFKAKGGAVPMTDSKS